jgi:hypothetical protein
MAYARLSPLTRTIPLLEMKYQPSKADRFCFGFIPAKLTPNDLAMQ